MNLSHVLDIYKEKEEKNIIITDPDGKLLYTSKTMEQPADTVTALIAGADEDFEEQEFFDRDNDLYLNIRKTVIEDGGERYFCYSFTDVRDYALLIQEVSSYIKSITNMSEFQTSIMKKLSMSYDTFLPGLADYCGAKEVKMFIRKDGKVTVSTYVRELTRVSSDHEDKYRHYFSMERGTVSDGFLCILNTSIQGFDCVVIVSENGKSAAITPMDTSIHNVIRLFIENSILRDHIVYESEHDKLTGLYNKGKYMDLKNESFGRPETIAVYNFDVNNLKHINDNYGHEYGDALIIKAAKSIAAVTSENVLGFRMGGDEYVMVALNVTRDEAEEIRTRWSASLDRLNEEDREMFCAMACGLEFGSGNYDYDELYAAADKQMYENKKALKSNNITSHIVQQNISERK